MNISDLFRNASTSTAKTASASPETPSAAPNNSALHAAMQSTLAEAQNERQKIANELAARAPTTPRDELEKVAAELMSANDARHIKLANDMGRAFGDGFLERIAAYEAVAEKTAGAQGLTPQEEQLLYDQFTGDWTQAVHTKTAEHYLHGHELVDQVAAALNAQKA